MPPRRKARAQTGAHGCCRRNLKAQTRAGADVGYGGKVAAARLFLHLFHKSVAVGVRLARHATGRHTPRQGDGMAHTAKPGLEMEPALCYHQYVASRRRNRFCGGARVL